MAELRIARQEKFAQHVAEGMTQDAAYEKAGYRRNRGNASELKSTQNVSARIAELQSATANQTEITAVALSKRLLLIASRAETKDEAPMLSVARASLMDVAKLNGLVVERTEGNMNLNVCRSLLELADD